MTTATFLRALEYLDDRYLTELDEITKEDKMHTTRNIGKLGRSLLIAAAIAAMLGTVAFAADLFGFRALLLNDKADYNGGEYAQISLSQPQEVPDGLDSAVAERVANAHSAWVEWQEWQAIRANQPVPQPPACYEYEPLGTHRFEIIANGDGTGTAIYYAEDGTVLQETALSPEEYAQCVAFDKFCQGVSGYDSNYGLHSDEDAAKLEEIAAKYGLNLRREVHILWSSETTGQSGESFLTNAQLCEKTAEIGNAGNIFRTVPGGFDKLYWFDEGSFAVSYYAVMPDGDMVECYAYNSMYSTLSSGKELINWEEDLSAFSQRSYNTADGTTVTILSNGENAYLYVYLGNSFLAMSISGEGTLTEADINTVADGLNYSLIGR